MQGIKKQPTLSMPMAQTLAYLVGRLNSGDVGAGRLRFNGIEAVEFGG